MRLPSSRLRFLRPVLGLSLIVLALSAAPAYASFIGPPKAHSPNADDIRTSYWVVLAVTGVIALVAIGGLLAAVARFREGAGEPRRVTAGRGAVSRVSAALGAIAIAIFVFGIVMTNRVRDVEPSGPNGLTASASQVAQAGVDGPVAALASQSESGEDASSGDSAGPDAPLAINVIGQQWLWRFEYPGGRPGQRTFSYNELTVPVDTTVVLNINSTDVLHRWFIPALGGQADAIPGDINQTWFRADREGRYPGQSTMFSGTSYPAMRSWVNVVSPTEYTNYIDQLSSDLGAAQAAVQKALARRSAAGEVTP